MKQVKFFALLVMAGFATFAVAQSNNSNDVGSNQVGSGMGGQGQGGQRHGPPPAAIDACKSKNSGAECSFIGRNNETRNGTCFSPSPEHPLACRPAQANHGMDGQTNQGRQSGMEGQEPSQQGRSGNNEMNEK